MFGIVRRLLLPALMVAAPHTQAQSWPDRPIKFISSQAAGNGTDVVGRLVADRLSARVGQGTGTDQSASSFVNTSWSGYSDVISTTQVLTSSYVRYAFIGTVASNATQVGASFAFTPVGTNTGNDAISMIGIQLQQGGVTPFEQREEQVELALCQRYFFQLNEPATGIAVAVGAVGAANATQFVIPLPVPMRAAPTVTTNSGQFVQSVSGA